MGGVSRAAKVSELWERGELDAALAAARRALAAAQSPDRRRDMAEVLAAVVLGSMHLPDPRVAEAAGLQAEFAAAAYGPTHEKTWRALASLAQIHNRHGRAELAQAAARRAMQLAEQDRTKGHPLLWRSWELLADLELKAGRTADAERSYKQALVALERSGRIDRADAWRPLSKLLGLAEDAGRLAEAEKLLRHILALKPSASDRGPSLDRAFDLRHLAQLQARQGKTSDAADSASRALTLVAGALDRGDVQAGHLARDVADLYFGMDRRDAGLRALRKAYEALRRGRGSIDPEVAVIAARIAALEPGRVDS
jgi:tetratricopeptide (TPR) repeat protein